MSESKGNVLLREEATIRMKLFVLEGRMRRERMFRDYVSLRGNERLAAEAEKRLKEILGDPDYPQASP